ncbi:MAG TPA: hypothetical protein VMD76_00005, partial [Candidatus Sulfotelmatobacter sp.]|nr:hypothetical protein [Candidatus Sulfotelmatobacter sp.]
MRNRTQSFSNLALLAGLTLIAFSILGYHPGLEDDSFYLAAIKRHLNLALFPHDAEFFRVQFQATIFDKLIALSVRLTHLPLMWAVLLWQLAAIFFLLHGCWRISRRCFARRESQWAATAFVAVLLSMPLPGIALNLADQYLHPRTLATAAILAAVVAVLDSRTENRRLWLAGLFLAIAFSIHAIMACFGISFCAFLYWTLHRRSGSQSVVPAAALLSFPLAWLFEPSSDAWRQAASTRDFYFLSRWHWYEWLGVFAPLLLLAAFRRVAARDRSPDTHATNSVLLPFLSALIYYGVFQTIVGIALMLPNSLSRVRPLEPMRYL